MDKGKSTNTKVLGDRARLLWDHIKVIAEKGKMT